MTGRPLLPATEFSLPARRDERAPAAGNAAGVDAERHQAWRRAMEQAQCRSWFDGGSTSPQRERVPEKASGTGPKAALSRAAGKPPAAPTKEGGAGFLRSSGEPHAPRQEASSAMGARSGPARDEARSAPVRGGDVRPDGMRPRALQETASPAAGSRPQGTMSGASARAPGALPSEAPAAAAQESASPVVGARARERLVHDAMSSVSAALGRPGEHRAGEPRGAGAFQAEGSALAGDGEAAEVREDTGGQEPEPVRPATPAASGAPEREPVRWHAEWSAEGLRLWLGVDRHLPPAELARVLVQELRPRCARAGTRLLTLVCNGRAVWSAEPVGPEPAATEQRTSSTSPSREVT